MVRNWIFLGDSLSEGVGSRRISYVSALASSLRKTANTNVHEFRLRPVDGPAVSRFIDFNVAGLMRAEAQKHPPDLWLWNLACEGRTAESDFGWLPLIETLRPELIVIFRGSLESIVRPAMVRDGDWPWWIPRAWRGYASMDPRCYFSHTWWRRAKQSALDTLKQTLRLKLLSLRPGKPLMDFETLAAHQSQLLQRLQKLDARVVVLGLLPVAQDRFPGSSDYFKTVNAALQEIARTDKVEFLDWGALLPANPDLFYRDGFHPNAAGAVVLAEILQTHLARLCLPSRPLSMVGRR